MRRWTGYSVAAALGMTVVLGATACSSKTNNATTGATVPATTAHVAFCDDLKDAITVVDRYGKVFSDQQLTIGDLQTAEKDLATSRAKLESSANTLADAITAANRTAAATSGTGATTTTVLATKTADEHLKAVDTADKELTRTLAGLDASTPIAQAAVEVQAAAFGLEQAYVSLFVDAGCLAKDAQAAQALNAYTTNLQQDLTTLGFYTGTIDGLYGPATVTAVEALQAAAGLPQTGTVDPATEAALVQQLAGHGKQQSLNIAALQGALAAAGFYTGPIDGLWTPATESALKAYQTAQSLPPTGAIDAATLAALLNGGQSSSSSSTTTTTVPGADASTTTSKP